MSVKELESQRPESQSLEKQLLEKAEMEIQRLLRINSELTARCEFLQQNFNGDYNELLIEYQALNRAFEILQLYTMKSSRETIISDKEIEQFNSLKKHKQCI
jgi:hypothetical protein